ncbi:DUF4181 domain-containing protein [Ammoniphilus resinae]|uniref:DUF4181 domain-containing protein n=1 Tax=Ammoniphilus resinae TaxID=861532 RepID=UPI003CC90B21
MNVQKWYWILYFVITMAFKSILERKYLKKSKQYVTTLIFLLISIAIIQTIFLAVII